ncbi:BlaI/MecI/CopY family transcriptional regulator [Bacillota bacterium Meth-B3]
MPTRLTSKEQEVLKLLMDSDRALTASEMVARDAVLNINTVQTVLRSLLKKGFIEVADIVYSGKVLCRNYKPTAQATEATFDAFVSQFHRLRRNVPAPQIFAGLIDGEAAEPAVLDELEALIAQRKAALAKRDT